MNGRDKLTVAEAFIQFLDAMKAANKQDTMDLTNQLVITNRGMFIVSVTPVTTVGTLQTIQTTTGT